MAASEDVLWPSDFERCSGSFENNFGSEYEQHSVIMCFIIRWLPYIMDNGHIDLFAH